MKQTDIGVFLHRISYSESSLITTFYTQNNGIQNFIFQGAKKKNKNFIPLAVCELTFYRRPDSELGKLTQVDNIHSINEILFNPIKSLIAFFIADVLRQTLRTNQKEEELFQFLNELTMKLNKSEDLGSFPLLFLIDFSSFIGIQPSLCDEDPIYFNLKEGEFHADYRIGEWCEEGETVKQLHELFLNKKIEPSFHKKAMEIILNYYQLHIPRFDVSTSLHIIREVLL